MGFGQRIVVAMLLTVVLAFPLAGFYSYFSGVPLRLFAGTTEDQEKAALDAAAGAAVTLVHGEPHTIEVSAEVCASLGIVKGEKDSVAVAQPPTTMRPLVLPGSTMLDPTRLARIRARFSPARVVEIGQFHDHPPGSGITEIRELRQGDHVSKGDLLGVFYSVEVGSKKNDLLQALVQLELDQRILDRVKANRSVVTEVYYLNEVRAVQGDRAEVNRALNNLKLWDIPQEEIDALHGEAKKLSEDEDAWLKTPEGKWVHRDKQAGHGTIDPHKEAESPWGRVTLRAPFDGVVVERNVHVDEMVIDNTVNLFQIADVRRLLVIANCPEDDLPALESLSRKDMRWTVRTVGAGSPKGLSGTIDEIGYLIDPNQHTAVIKGYVDNPGERIRAGQYVSATVNIPPPSDVVEIPDDALVDDGRQSLVFVQPDPAKHVFAMRRVQVTHRFADSVFVRKSPIPKEEQLTALEAEEGLLPKEPLRPGERVLTAGSVELKRVVIDLESQPKEHEKTKDLLARTKARPRLPLESQPEHKPRARKG
jgi:cobalt-zinc-cadmium efflux system membrane fusion protein